MGSRIFGLQFRWLNSHPSCYRPYCSFIQNHSGEKNYLKFWITISGDDNCLAILKNWYQANELTIKPDSGKKFSCKLNVSLAAFHRFRKFNNYVSFFNNCVRHVYLFLWIFNNFIQYKNHIYQLNLLPSSFNNKIFLKNSEKKRTWIV